MSETQNQQENPFHMSGTEGTGEYKVLASSSFGRVGYRDLGYEVRVRVEPSPTQAENIAQTLSPDAGWKQPGDGGQDRFSIIVPKGEAATAALSDAFALIKRGRPLVYNPPVSQEWRDAVS
ncbi:MAG: hypothetical protein JWM07_92 [Candidatus Saccharibacteria bacterium]|jgi:hypothetical protein|nr:hypothetical protein [Candidatus Saccharibacteria bacterium]